MTAADILRVARDRLDPKHLTIVAVGNPKEFGGQLTALGMPVTDLDITIPEPKSQTTAAPVDPQSIAQGGALLKQAQAAAGGLEKLTAIKDIRETRSMQFDASAGGLKSSQVNYFLMPSTFRQENVLPFGKVIAYSDGKSGFVHNPQMSMPLSGPLLKQIQGEILREYVALLLSDHASSRTVSLAGENTLRIADKDGNSVEVKLDPATGLIATESYSQQQPSGPPSAITIAMSDYKDVDGVKMPFKMTITQGEKKVGEATISEYKFNSGLKAEELSKQQ
ncbi:MAG TPA: hypothetical protein VGL72_27420 [Bryobacteraceae bacterium]